MTQFNSAKEKGTALEKATRAIYELLLRKQGLGEDEVWFEPNHRFVAGGARNEIDILVRFNPNSKQERLWLFECKNRKAKVSKNDIVVLAYKVRELRAEKGVLVARSFGTDSIALAKHEGIELEVATDGRWLPDGLIGMENSIFEFHSLKAQVCHFGDDANISEPDWLRDVCRFDSNIHNFGELVRDSIYSELESKRKSMSQLPGTVAQRGSLTLEFEPNELWVGKWNISYVQTEFDYSITNQTSKLVSTFSIAKKGRFAEFVLEPKPANNDDIRVEVLGNPKC